MKNEAQGERRNKTGAGLYEVRTAAMTRQRHLIEWDGSDFILLLMRRIRRLPTLPTTNHPSTNTEFCEVYMYPDPLCFCSFRLLHLSILLFIITTTL